MGLLDILGGSRRGMSPLTIALLGLIAHRALKGRNLSDIFGGMGYALKQGDRTRVREHCESLPLAVGTEGEWVA